MINHDWIELKCIPQQFTLSGITYNVYIEKDKLVYIEDYLFKKILEKLLIQCIHQLIEKKRNNKEISIFDEIKGD